MIAGIGKVLIDVEDQQRAMRFWTDTMGFTLLADEAYGKGRWLEVGTPDGRTRLILHRREGPPPSAPPSLPTSNVFFRTDDLARTFSQLRERGVSFPQEPVQQPWGWWSMFSDTEGNRFALQPTDT